MKDRLTPTDWTEQIPQPRPGWDRNLSKSKIPVVKLTYPDGYALYAITTPVIRGVEEDKGLLVTSLDFQVSERGSPSSLTTVSIDELKAGRLELRGKVEVKVEFDGLAGDPKHRDKEWSYHS